MKCYQHTLFAVSINLMEGEGYKPEKRAPGTSEILVSPHQPERETDRERETLEHEDGERVLSGVNREDSGPDGCGFSPGGLCPARAVRGHLEGPAGANSARGSQGDSGHPRPSVPDDVVAVAPVELLPVLPRAVHHADARHEVHDLLGRRVVEVVAALVAPVAVHPLEPQVAARGAPGRHVRAPTSPLRSGPRWEAGGGKREAAAAGRSKPSPGRLGLAACRVL